jgi:hypothetical protein
VPLCPPGTGKTLLARPSPRGAEVFGDEVSAGPLELSLTVYGDGEEDCTIALEGPFTLPTADSNDHRLDSATTE